jgi:NAD(P)H-dependent nitrite reductase small subunit
MGRWVDVARAEEIRVGEGRTVEADGDRIALFNDGGEYFAIDDSCPHQGASLGEGMLHEGNVICPWHSLIFDLRTGRCLLESQAGVRRFETRCRDGRVQVKLLKA